MACCGYRTNRICTGSVADDAIQNYSRGNETIRVALLAINFPSTFFRLVRPKDFPLELIHLPLQHGDGLVEVLRVGFRGGGRLTTLRTGTRHVVPINFFLGLARSQFKIVARVLSVILEKTTCDANKVTKDISTSVAGA